MRPKYRKLAITLMMTIALTLSGAISLLRADTSNCSGANTTVPFTDVAGNGFFCAIAAAYFSGLTNGTSATTYSPNDAVPRAQMAAFVTRTLDQSLKRGSRRAALSQWWTTTPHYTITAGTGPLGTTAVGTGPQLVQSDGEDLWVANQFGDTVSRVHASSGVVLQTWGMATDAIAPLVAMGRVFVAAETSPGRLYMIDPNQAAPLNVTTVANNLGTNPRGIAFDGAKIWVANNGTGPGTGSVSVVTPGTPFTVTTLTTNFSRPHSIIFDGANIWVSDTGDNTLKKLNADGSIAQTVPFNAGTNGLVFDGMNLWVPLGSNSVAVVRAATGSIMATLTGNGLNGPVQAAFDGERILITNLLGNSVSLWKATDLTPLGSFSTGANSLPYGACSDGVNFWVTLPGIGKLARF